jgi:hypothetical protein
VQICRSAQAFLRKSTVSTMFNVISAFLADNNQRFVAEVEAIEL